MGSLVFTGVPLHRELLPLVWTCIAINWEVPLTLVGEGVCMRGCSGLVALGWRPCARGLVVMDGQEPGRPRLIVMADQGKHK